jgi:hypothetical protein
MTCIRCAGRDGRALLGIWLAVIAAAAFLAGPLHGQGFFGSIVGAITDASQAAVPGARVTLNNIGTGETKASEADAAGNYQFLNLIPGMYKVEVERAGFKRFTRDQIQVVVQAAVRVDVQLQVGEVGQTVEVSAQALALQTETATLSQAVGGRNVTEMPLNGRNVYSLVALVPGVVMEGAAPQIGGGMANQNATYVDGVPMNTAYFNQTAAAPTQDSVEEFRVQTNTASAEFGRFAGGIISLTSKTGTNEFHGTAYEFLRNKVLNGNTFFSNRSGLVRPPFTQNQFGGTFGGPIRRNKTFFFASYEGFRQRQGVNFVLSVPTAKMLAGDFSELPAGATIHDPLSSSNGSNRTAFPGNVLPASRLDPTAVILSKMLWTAPNQPGLNNNWVNNASGGQDNNTLNIRVDHNLTEKQRMFARYNLAKPAPRLVAPYNTNIYTFGTRPSFYTTAVFGDTYSFSPTMFFDFRASFLRNHNFRYPDQLGLDLTTIGWPAGYNTQDLTRTLPQLCVTNYDFTYAGQGGYCQGNPQSVIIVTNNVFDLAPSVSKIMGRHTLKVGLELRKAQLMYLQQNNNSGNFSFTSGMTAQNALAPGNTGYAFASMMLGFGAINSGTNALGLNAATTGLELYQAYYVNDTFVVNRKLTLNYGLRWEGMGPFYEKWDRHAVLLPGAQNPLVANQGTVALVNSPGYPNRGISPHPYNLFSPRFGVAYRATDKWVIRTGAGINFLPTDGNILSSPFGAPINTISTPWVPSLDGGLTPAATLHNPFPNGITVPPQRSPNYQQALLGLAVSAPQPNNPYGYTVQYNFAVQRELQGGAVLEVAYAGLKGVHLYRFTGHQYNQLPDSYLALGTQLLQQVPNPYYGKVAVGTLAQPTVAYGQLLRPFPQYTGFLNVGEPDGNSRYHALQVKLEKRSQRAGTILVSYTRSKLISDLEQQAAFTSGVGAYIVQDYNNLRAERSLAAYDIPQTLIVSYVYDLPMGKGHSFLGHLPSAAEKLASGWGINGITTFQAGPPLSFIMATNNTNSFGGTPRPNVSAGCAKSISGSAQSRLSGWFNTGCFSSPPAFSFGSQSRTDPSLRAAGVNNFDFAAFKNTAITERFSLEFRAEVFNLFNRVQFSPPNTTVGSSTFGVVAGQANNPRLVQLALRLRF